MQFRADIEVAVGTGDQHLLPGIPSGIHGLLIGGNQLHICQQSTEEIPQSGCFSIQILDLWLQQCKEFGGPDGLLAERTKAWLCFQQMKNSPVRHGQRLNRGAGRDGLTACSSNQGRQPHQFTWTSLSQRLGSLPMAHQQTRLPTQDQENLMWDLIASTQRLAGLEVQQRGVLLDRIQNVLRESCKGRMLLKSRGSSVGHVGWRFKLPERWCRSSLTAPH